MSSEPKPNIRPGVRGICRNGFWTPPLESGPFDRVTAGPMYWTSRGQYDDGESPWDIIGIVEDLPPVPSPQQKSYWRLLEPGEVIQEGDEFWDYRLGKFAPTSVIIGMVPESAVYRRRVHAPEPQPAPQIPAMPEGWEVDPDNEGFQNTHNCYVQIPIRRIKPPEPVCVYPLGQLKDGWLFQHGGANWFSDCDPSALLKSQKLICAASVLPFRAQPKWRDDVPESERCVKVGPEEEKGLEQ